MLIGYARTSTDDQVAGLEAQIRDLMAAGCDRCFSEHASATAEVREQFDEAFCALLPGDVLMVTKPDRLARNTRRLLDIVEELGRMDVGLIVLSMGGERFDTRNPTSKLILTVLGAVAAWERDMMLERQKEGIAKARRDKKYKGRLPVIDAGRAAEIAKLHKEGLAGHVIAARLGVGKTTVYQHLLGS